MSAPLHYKLLTLLTLLTLLLLLILLKLLPPLTLFKQLWSKKAFMSFHVIWLYMY